MRALALDLLRHKHIVVSVILLLVGFTALIGIVGAGCVPARYCSGCGSIIGACGARFCQMRHEHGSPVDICTGSGRLIA